MVEFSVMPARPSDISEIAALDRAVWGEWANPAPLYRQLIDLYPDTIFVARAAGDKIAGCVVGLIRPRPCVGWILSIDLLPEFRGKGLGRLLVERSLSAFEAHGAERVEAMIDPENIASQKLFTSLGFRTAKLEEDYFRQGRPQQRWVKRSTATETASRAE